MYHYFCRDLSGLQYTCSNHFKSRVMLRLSWMTLLLLDFSPGCLQLCKVRKSFLPTWELITGAPTVWPYMVMPYHGRMHGDRPTVLFTSMWARTVHHNTNLLIYAVLLLQCYLFTMCLLVMWPCGEYFKCWGAILKFNTSLVVDE